MPAKPIAHALASAAQCRFSYHTQKLLSVASQCIDLRDAVGVLCVGSLSENKLTLPAVYSAVFEGTLWIRSDLNSLLGSACETKIAISCS